MRACVRAFVHVCVCVRASDAKSAPPLLCALCTGRKDFADSLGGGMAARPNGDAEFMSLFRDPVDMLSMFNPSRGLMPVTFQTRDKPATAPNCIIVPPRCGKVGCWGWTQLQSKRHTLRPVQAWACPKTDTRLTAFLFKTLGFAVPE